MDAPQRQQRFVLLGTVTRAHGVSGEVSVQVDDPALADEFRVQKSLWLEGAGLSKSLRQVESVRRTAKGLSIRFEGVNDRNAAELLRGAKILRERSLLTTLSEGEYLTGDLMGLEVRTPTDEVLGTVTEVEGAGEVMNLVVSSRSSDSAEALQIPLAEAFIQRIDLDEGVIVAVKPEELEDA